MTFHIRTESGPDLLDLAALVAVARYPSVAAPTMLLVTVRGQGESLRDMRVIHPDEVRRVDRLLRAVWKARGLIGGQRRPHFTTID